jgi:hypothetical protein
MPFWGDGPFENDFGDFILGGTIARLTQTARVQIAEAFDEGKLDHGLLGAAACLRALAEAFPKEAKGEIGRDEVEAWQTLYFRWLDRNADKLRRKRLDPERMRRIASDEFRRLLDRCGDQPFFDENGDLMFTNPYAKWLGSDAQSEGKVVRQPPGPRLAGAPKPTKSGVAKTESKAKTGDRPGA